MDNKKLIILSLLFFVFISCGAISHTVNAAPKTVYVNSGTGSDTYDGTRPTHTTGPHGPKKTIQNAINTVTTGGVINVAHGIYHEHITISKSLTIKGTSKTNTIIEGTNTRPIIHIIGNIVVIKHLTLRNGKSGAITNDGDLTVHDCTFTKNTASHGGAIYNDGKLTATGCTFTSNTAFGWGGAIENDRNLTVHDCTFTKNTASYGGAIDNWETLTVTDTTFTKNTATKNGGAISNSALGSLVIHSSKIMGNSLKEIYKESGSVDAKYNWWGSDADPSGKVTSGVTVTPWLVSPKIISTYPKNNSKKISRTKTIVLKFNKNIKASTAWKKITIKKKGKKITITKKWIKGNTLYIKTKKRISRAYYTVTIPQNAIKDIYNINLLKQYIFKFKTK